MNDNVHPTLRSALAGMYNAIQISLGSPLRIPETEPEKNEVFAEMLDEYEMRITLEVENE